MTFVISLSKPFDFYPVDDFLSIELFEIDGISIIKKNISDFSKKIPKENFIIVENGIRQFSEIVNNVIFLPELSFFEQLFLISTFINANFLDPKVLVMSGNVIFEDMDKIIKTIDKIILDEFLSGYPLIFFCGENGNFNKYIEKRFYEDLRFFYFKRFGTLREYEADKNKFSGFSEFYYFHAIKLKEIFCGNDELAYLYFMAEEAWKTEKDWGGVIENLKKINITEIVSKENPLLFEIDSKVKFYNKVSDLLNFFKTDDDRNIIIGNVEIENVTNSIIINQDALTVSVRNQSNCLVLVKDGYIKIEKI